MVPTTRGASARAFNHLISEVLELEDTSPLSLALAEKGFTKITHLLSLEDADFHDLTYKHMEENQDPIDIYVKDAHTLELLNAILYYKSIAASSKSDAWFETDGSTFATWLASYTPPPASSDSEDDKATKPTYHSSNVSAHDAFLRQIRRTPSDFTKFSKDSEWSTWNRSLLATATAQAVHQSYNLEYVPTPDEIPVFTAIQQYNYSVLVSVVQTAFGRGAVREFESTFDAQGVYRLLVNHYSKGITASIQAQSLEEEILGMRLDDKHRKGCEFFLNTWHLKIQELDTIRSTIVPGPQKRIWLTSALQTHPQMSTAITQANTMEHTMAGINKSVLTQLDFPEFFDLCLTTAKHVDKNLQVVNKQKREAHTAQKKPASNKPATSTRRTSARQQSTPGTPQTTRGPPAKDSKWWVDPAVWKAWTFEDKKKHWEKKNAATQSNQTRTANRATTTHQDAATTAPPTSIHIPMSVQHPPSAATSVSAPNLREMLSNTANSNRYQPLDDSISFGGATYRRANHHNIQYCVQNFQLANDTVGSLIDGGANGGFAGSDVRVIEYTNEKADVSGIAGSVVKDLAIGTVAGLLQTTSGPVIGIFHQYAIHGEGSTIHAPNQFRAFDIDVNEIPERSPCKQGKQRIVTPEGYIIKLKIRHGLPYMQMTPPTNAEMDAYAHVIFTSDVPWDPTCFDDSSCDGSDDEDHPMDPRITIYGDAVERHAHGQVLHKHTPNLEAMRPYFGWVPLARIQRTFEVTNQFARADRRLPMRKHFKTRFPAANVSRLEDVVATDTFFSDTPAHDDGILGHGGATMVQLYTGVKTQFTKAYPMGSETEMPGTFEDFIREVGAPTSLFSDNAKVQIGSAVRNILRMYAISNFQCEPHHQHQNPAERKIQEVKKLTNAILDCTGTHHRFWLLCLLFVVQLLNVLASESLNWETPTYKATGQRPDISPFLIFHFGELVLYSHDNKFPSDSPELRGYYMGPASHQGDILTHLILTIDTEQVITRSAVRKANDPDNPNFRAMAITSSEDGETHAPAVQSTADVRGLSINPSELMLPKLSPEELLGLTFIRNRPDGQKVRAKVIKQVHDDDAANHQNIKFIIELGQGDLDEIIAYNELSALVEEQREYEVLNPDRAWIYKAIIGHEGPLNPKHPKYKGSSYNVLVLWEDGSESYEPLSIIRKDDPITCAKYAKEHGLLDTEGWKQLKRIASRTKLYKRMCKQAAMKSIRHGPIYKFGVQVPCNKAEARRLDEANGNTVWQDAEKSELSQLHEYDTFLDKGVMRKPPTGYKFIRVHFVYDCKHDLRCKARMVAGGHMTTANSDDSYSGVVTLRSLRICLLLGELNGLKIGVGNVGNAYLEAETKEKVYIIAGPEFGELAGHTLIIFKALYGLRTSGARFHERFAATLRDMGFTPSFADPDVWMRDAGDHWEYLAVYVDDLMAIMKEPGKFFDVLKDKYKYKLKGVGTPKYHLGGDFYRDEDGTLAKGAKTYIKKLLLNYEQMFGGPPKEFSAPLDPKDHPEIDGSPLLDADGIKRYQSLLGALQWAITLGRFDLLPSVVSLSSFRVAPRIGHLDRAKRICGYLRKNPDSAIRFRTQVPFHEDRYTKPDVSWISTVYGNVQEELPYNMPTPKGKMVRTTTNVDANLMHCLVTGRSLTGILHFVNQCPIEWFSKKQNTVESATFGSEFVAARIATDQLIDLRYTLRMFGAPLDGSGWMFGDNESVITNSTIPSSTLKKRHNALSYHRVREACAAGVMWFIHTPGKTNVADVLTKYLPWCDMKDKIGPVLFWKGDTMKSPPPKLRGVTGENVNQSSHFPAKLGQPKVCTKVNFAWST